MHMNGFEFGGLKGVEYKISKVGRVGYKMSLWGD